jgi:hypothetical protein
MRSNCWRDELRVSCDEIPGLKGETWGARGLWRNQNGNAGPSTAHPSDEDLSLGTPDALRCAQDDRSFGKGGR